LPHCLGPGGSHLASNVPNTRKVLAPHWFPFPPNRPWGV
jgi:hypothetical protein